MLNSNDLTRLVILGNEEPGEQELWLKACQESPLHITWRVVDLTADSWLQDLHTEPFDLLLTKPGGLTSAFKQLYDERLRILAVELGYPCFPSYPEVLIYENKRYLAAWLQAQRLPHPETHVFYRREEAKKWCSSTIFPLVAKTNIGASGSGVVILNNEKETWKYLCQAFTNKGAPLRWGPNLAKGRILARAYNALKSKGYLKERARIYLIRRGEKQRGFVILQEYVPHDYEWRVVRMGDSFFAHKKLKSGEKTSGSLLKGYGQPPLDLLDFVKEVTDRFGFYSQSVDIFESERGYLINEMQCFFGQSDPHQMIIAGIPGRYRHLDGSWQFEQGDFNANQSFSLRLESALDFYHGGRLC